MNVIEKVVLFIILILAAMFCEQVHADNFFVVSVHAYHWNRNDAHGTPATKPVCLINRQQYIECNWSTGTPSLNENNFGLGYEHTSGNSVYGAGFYNNSNYKLTTYLSYAYMPIHFAGIAIGPIVSLVTGYPIAPIAVMGGAEVRYDVGKFGLNLMLVPTATVNNVKATGFAGLQLRWRF